MAEIKMMAKIKMIPERKALLIEALLSGEYSQGPGRLCSTDKFCCMGVACDIHRKSHPDNLTLKWEDAGYDDNETMMYLEHSIFMPEEVSEWFGFPIDSMVWIDVPEDVKEKYNIPNHRCNLAQLNDSGVPFSIIAKIIEEQL